MPTAIVSGALANKPFNGGNAWSRLSWIRGLQQLGFTVYFVEQASSVADPGFFESVMQCFGLLEKSALLNTRGESLSGLDPAALIDIAANADLLFNIGGHLFWEPLKQAPRVRVYYDDDPGYTQFWREGARLAGHDYYFTIGENIGSPDCGIPSGDIAWKFTRPPVVLEDWPVCMRPPVDATGHRFTTVASWRGAYGRVECDGKLYGVKAHEFRKFITFPSFAPHRFEIALGIDPADENDRQALVRHGWKLVDPLASAGTPDIFRCYVQNSAAEFSVAQGIYVETNSGWFSDRTTRYLASGKPALVQDTGFAAHLPAAEGLLAFRTMDEAVAGAAEISRNYSRHSRVARQIAEEFFDARKVARRLLEQIA
jgi:hypothetical protein